ncbi:MAG TPA: (2Fe-2S) ferredoxin domain-containing protein [Myxococcota bacterium]|jgi:(2Fe-2S) ferredoxin|nr:(2Fe-2S) ferredoxin domain-containing protein [Myxococcota bacterium]
MSDSSEGGDKLAPLQTGAGADPNPRYQRHIFVCTNVRPPGHPKGCCTASGSEQVRTWFKEGVLARGLKGVVRANAAGCLDQCEFGPTVVVYPDEVWYRVSTKEEVDEVLDQHIVGGRIVQRLQIRWPAAAEGGAAGGGLFEER